MRNNGIETKGDTLCGTACITVRLKEGFIPEEIVDAEPDELLSNYSIGRLSGVLFSVLDNWVTTEFDGTRDFEELTEDEFYCCDNSLVYFIDVKQDCTVYIDSSVGFEWTEDSLEIPEKKLCDILKKELVNKKCKDIADAVLATEVAITVN